QRMGDGRGGVEMLPAIGKRIRGDVDDAHHPRTVQPQRAAGAVQYRRGVEHQRRLLARTRLPIALSATPSTMPMKMPARYWPVFTPKATPATVAMTISGMCPGVFGEVSFMSTYSTAAFPTDGAGVEAPLPAGRDRMA